MTHYDRTINALDCSRVPAPAKFTLPTVWDTMTAYQSFLAALVPEDQLVCTQHHVEAFLNGDAEDLEQQLQGSTDYSLPNLRLKEQLQERPSVMFSPAQAIVLRPDPSAERNTQLERAARLLSAVLSIKVQADSGAAASPCPPTLFGQTRLPMTDEDAIGVFRSKHICISHNHVWWSFDVYDDAGRPLTTRVLEDTLKAITAATPPWATPAIQAMLDDEGKLQLNALFSEVPEEGKMDRVVHTPKTPATADGRPVSSKDPSRPQSPKSQCSRLATGTLLALAAGDDPSPPVGALTWLPRDDWAVVHTALLGSTLTRRSVERLESAILCLVLSPAQPVVDTPAALHAIAHDGGRDRWGDKLLTIVVCDNGVAGFVGGALGDGYGPLHRLATSAWERANTDHSVAVDRQALLEAAALQQRLQVEAERRREEERSREAERQRGLEQEEALRRKVSNKVQKSKAVVAKSESELPSRPSEVHARAAGPSDGDSFPISDWDGNSPTVSSDFHPTPYAALEWDLSPVLRSRIQQAEQRCGQLLSQWDMRQLELPFGERELRALKSAPMAFLHLAVQLAYYRLHSKACVVAQATPVASAGGLWQCCPTVTAQSQHLCRAHCGMTRHKPHPQAMHTLLLEAAAEQAALLEQFAKALQWPTHLVALCAASQKRRFAEGLQKWLTQQRRSAQLEMELRREARVEARRLAEESERMEEGARDLATTTTFRKGASKKAEPARKPETFSGKDREAPLSAKGTLASSRPHSGSRRIFGSMTESLSEQEGPRATRQSLNVVPHPLFQDELYRAVSRPLITLYEFRPSPAVASVIVSPPAVEAGMAVACTVQAHSIVLYLSSATLPADKLTEFTETVVAVMQELFRDCVVDGAPTSTAILPKENGQHRLARKQAPAPPPLAPVVIAAFRR
eukprot:GGOE01053583.1.p1 GENE.GGOE01053583.1~~GGOE01053583.1.p1  ORF type:complete len:959 (-),score=243.33 GGOE01053583.1:192-2930(-)